MPLGGEEASSRTQNLASPGYMRLNGYMSGRRRLALSSDESPSTPIRRPSGWTDGSTPSGDTRILLPVGSSLNLRTVSGNLQVGEGSSAQETRHYLMASATINAPNRYDISVCEKAIRRICLLVRSVSEI